MAVSSIRRLPRPFLVPVVALVATLAAALPAAAQLVPVGEPIDVVSPADLFLAADGRFATVWAAGGDGAPASLWMQPRSWSGEPLAPPLRLDAERPAAEAALTAGGAPDGSGDFVVAWAEGPPGRFAYRRAGVGGELGPIESLALAEETWGLPVPAVDGAGAVSWAWRELAGGFGGQDFFLRIRVRPAGGPTVDVSSNVYVPSLDLAASAAGTLWLAFEHTSHLQYGIFSGFAVFAPTASGWVHAFESVEPYRGGARVAVDGAGGALLLVDSLGVPDFTTGDGVCSGVFAQPASADGTALGPATQVNPAAAGCQHGFAVRGAASGGFLVAWRSLQGAHAGSGDSSQDGLWLRTYAGDGSPAGDPLRFAGGERLTAADLEGGRAVVAAGGRLHRFASPPAPCTAGPTHLCLGGGRFRVDVDQRNPYPPFGEGAARAVPLTADTGAFWFFHPGNLELMLKVLDARPLDGHWWVFSAGLSTVEHWIAVSDGATGRQARYHNPPFTLGGRADTGAFDGSAAAAAAAVFAGRGTAAGECFVAGAIPACDDPGVLCLHDGRFALSVAWRDPRSGAAGAGWPRAIAADTAAFWFFHPENLELMAKVLDARPLDGHWWVFGGSLSDVEHTLVVVDRETGLARRYVNAPYTLGSYADTAAFVD